MDNHDSSPKRHSCALKAGEQAVINGALVTALGDCKFEVCTSASVFTGRKLSAGRVREPHMELYLSLIQIAGEAARFEEERLRLFGLLSQIVLEDASPEAAAQTRRCMLAMLGGELDEATQSAELLAASQLESGSKAEHHRPRVRGHARPSLPISSDGWRDPLK